MKKRNQDTFEKLITRVNDIIKFSQSHINESSIQNLLSQQPKEKINSESPPDQLNLNYETCRSATTTTKQDESDYFFENFDKLIQVNYNSAPNLINPINPDIKKPLLYSFEECFSEKNQKNNFSSSYQQLQQQQNQPYNYLQQQLSMNNPLKKAQHNQMSSNLSSYQQLQQNDINSQLNQNNNLLQQQHQLLLNNSSNYKYSNANINNAASMITSQNLNNCQKKPVIHNNTSSSSSNNQLHISQSKGSLSSRNRQNFYSFYNFQQRESSQEKTSNQLKKPTNNLFSSQPNLINKSQLKLVQQQQNQMQPHQQQQQILKESQKQYSNQLQQQQQMGGRKASGIGIVLDQQQQQLPQNYCRDNKENNHGLSNMMKQPSENILNNNNILSFINNLSSTNYSKSNQNSRIQLNCFTNVNNNNNLILNTEDYKLIDVNGMKFLKQNQQNSNKISQHGSEINNILNKQYQQQQPYEPQPQRTRINTEHYGQEFCDKKIINVPNFLNSQRNRASSLPRSGGMAAIQGNLSKRMF